MEAESDPGKLAVRPAAIATASRWGENARAAYRRKTGYDILSMDPSPRTVGRTMQRSSDWLEAAREDLEHAGHAEEGGYFQWACFSAQQAAEKAVKAVFQSMGAEAWGHSVSDLLDELADRRNVPDELVDRAIELDKAYIATRYPDAHQSGTPGQRYTRREANRLRGYAEEILEFSEGLVSDADA